MVLNGRLPANLLAALPWPEASRLRLRPDAAASLGRLAAAFEHHFNTPLRITDAYRTFASQVVLKVSKGKFAATPGTSNHGLGIAIDAASSINVETSAQHRWMEANGPRYGWVNPGWAVDRNPANGQHEPWHWEYHPELDTRPAAPAPVPLIPIRKAPTMRVICNPEQAERWITDGVHKRWITEAGELTDLLRLCDQTEALVLGRFVTDRIPNAT